MNLSIALVVAIGKDGVIGNDGALPWRLSSDMKRFKADTMGKPVIMGRKTHAGIGKPLPGRDNIVVSRDSEYEAPGCDIVGSIEQAIDVAKSRAGASGATEICIIGGGEIYRLFLQMAHRIYLTRVQAEINGDTTFPELDMDEWDVSLVAEYPAGDEREFGFDIETLDRK